MEPDIILSSIYDMQREKLQLRTHIGELQNQQAATQKKLARALEKLSEHGLTLEDEEEAPEEIAGEEVPDADPSPEHNGRSRTTPFR